MKSVSPYLKAIAGALMAGLAGMQQAFPGSRWVSAASLVLVPVMVYLVPNVTWPPAPRQVPAAPDAPAEGPPPATPSPVPSPSPVPPRAA